MIIIPENLVANPKLIYAVNLPKCESDKCETMDELIELAKKYHLPKEVITAIAHHHDQIFPNHYVIITKISDTISAGRKGARTISEIGFKQAKIAESICKKNIFVRGVYTISGTNFLKIIVIPKRNYYNRLAELRFDLLNALKKNKNFIENNVEIIFSNIKEKKINS